MRSRNPASEKLDEYLFFWKITLFYSGRVRGCVRGRRYVRERAEASGTWTGNPLQDTTCFSSDITIFVVR